LPGAGTTAAEAFKLGARIFGGLLLESTMKTSAPLVALAPPKHADGYARFPFRHPSIVAAA